MRPFDGHRRGSGDAGDRGDSGERRRSGLGGPGGLGGRGGRGGQGGHGRRAEDVEDDPTGVRELLAGLPDPGPMPPEVTARILAALDAERLRAADTPAPTGSPTPATGSTPSSGSTPGPRSTPTWGRWLVGGAAASVVALAGVGLLDTLGGSGDDSAGSVASSLAEGAARDASPPAAVVTMTMTDYTRANLATQAASLRRAGAPTVAPFADEPPSIGPIASPLGAASCAHALGVPGSATVRVDIATLEGSPAAIVLVDDAGELTAYAVSRSCTTGEPGLLVGPVPVR